MVSNQPIPTQGKQNVTQSLVEKLDHDIQATDAIINDLHARTQKGIETYGRPLETFNGRDAFLDMYEELLDAFQYAEQTVLENMGPDGSDVKMFIASDVREAMLKLCVQIKAYQLGFL